MEIFSQKDQDDLQKLQNKVLRNCLNIVDPLDMNVIEMHRLVGVDMVDQRRKKCLITTIHKGVLDKKHNMLDHGVNTRLMMVIKSIWSNLEMILYENHACMWVPRCGTRWPR